MGGLQAETNKYTQWISKEGWYRLFRINESGYGLFFTTKTWSEAKPSASLVSFNRLDVKALLNIDTTYLNVHKVRIVEHESKYYIDIFHSGNANDGNMFTVDVVRSYGCTYMDLEPVSDESFTLVKLVSLIGA